MAEARKVAKKTKVSGEDAVLATIAAMSDADRAIGERLHALIRSSAPELSAKLWYGQPAYAKAGKVVCFFRSAGVDKERYLTLGFSSTANLDDGTMWATSYALTALSPADESRLGELVTRAAS